MDINELVKTIKNAMRGDLPGTAAQLCMAPSPRPGWKPGHLPEHAREAAALILLYPNLESTNVLLTKRRPDLPDHAGQVSFPGGALDEGETMENAALREAEEEVGADPASIRILGRLTPLYIPVSRFNLHPVVGIARRRGDWSPHDVEVARILETPLENLLDPARHLHEDRNLFDGVKKVPYFLLHGEKVWGATAMVLAELLAILGVCVETKKAD